MHIQMQVITNSYTKTNTRSNGITTVYTHSKVIANGNANVNGNANADVNAKKTHRQN